MSSKETYARRYERSSNDSRAKGQRFRQWKQRADDKIAAITHDREHYRSQLSEVNRQLKVQNRQAAPTANFGKDARLALRFMETAKQHLSEMQFHQLLQLAQGSLREQTE